MKKKPAGPRTATTACGTNGDSTAIGVTRVRVTLDRSGLWLAAFGWDFAYWFPWAWTPYSKRQRGLPHWWGRVRLTRVHGS